MKDITCCFTGHRAIPAEKFMYIRSALDREVEKAIAAGYKNFCAGGALGFDTQAALSVLAARKTHTDIRLVLVLPCKDQTKGWPVTDRENYNIILSRADEVIYVSEGYTRFCMQLRNRALVDRSSLCIAYLEKPTGGTAYTVNYAAKKGLRVVNLMD